jgi:DNA-binding LacI/PurR family transcriptional regulator
MGLEAARVLLTAHPDLTALICGNEAMALGALRHAQAKGLSVPGDLSITGMDNLKVSSLITPALTTVDQHLFDLGRLGARQLLAMIQGETTPAREISPVDLRVRASPRPPRRPA